MCSVPSPFCGSDICDFSNVNPLSVAEKVPVLRKAVNFAKLHEVLTDILAITHR